MTEYAVRPMRQSDLPLIYDTWCTSYHAHCTTWLGWISRDTFRDIYELLVRSLLDKAYVRVACLADDDKCVVGWACVRDDVLHYVWVREQWRGEGVCRLLLADMRSEPIKYTHETDYWRQRAPHFPGWQFDCGPLRSP